MMLQFPLSSLRSCLEKYLLPVCWLCGVLVGVFAAQGASPFLSAMMRGAADGPVSIVGLFTAGVLPFLLSAYAISICAPGLLLVICGCKGVTYGFGSFAVSLAFGHSSWLVRFLFLFSDHILLPVLYLYWLRHFLTERRFSVVELAAVLALAVVVVIVDFCVVSPFLAAII